MALRELASREGEVIAREYVEAKSAKEPGTRPEFEALLAGVRGGEVDGILTWQINRLCRNMLDGGQIAHLLHSGKLNWIKTPDRVFLPEDSALLLAIETGVATSFIQDLRRSVKRGMEGKARRGWLPGRVPLGYRNNPVTGEIDIDPDRFFIVQRGWEMLGSGGYTVADVVRMFRKVGLTGVDRGKPIAMSRVCHLFRSEFYTGQFRYGGELLQGKHQAMISRHTYEAAQRFFAKKSGQRDPEQKHPYAGIFKCPNCGCAITAETKVKRYKASARTASYTYYRCTGARGCRKAGVRSETLDMALSALAERIVLPPNVKAWLERSVAAHLGNWDVQQTASSESIQRQIGRLDQRLRRIRDMRIDEELGAKEYAAEKGEIEERLASLRSGLSRLDVLANEVQETVEQRLDLIERASSWQDMAAAARRGFLRSLAKRAFLTLDKVEFEVDAITAHILSIEPRLSGSQSQEKRVNLELSSSWSPLWDTISNLESDQSGLSGEAWIISVDFSRGGGPIISVHRAAITDPQHTPRT